MHLFHLNNLKWVIHSPEHLIKILGSLPAGTVGGRNAYSKGEEKKGGEKMRKPNLQKQAIPDLFSKTRGNISVTIALKGQGLTWQCSSSAFFGKHSLENASAFKKGTQNTPSAWCSPQVTDPCSGSYVQGVKTPSSSGSRCHGDNWMMDS